MESRFLAGRAYRPASLLGDSGLQAMVSEVKYGVWIFILPHPYTLNFTHMLPPILLCLSIAQIPYVLW
jgi:hypothetical protein